MSRLSVLDGEGAHADAATRPSQADAAARASQLVAEIKHHRATLDDLLEQRRQHAIDLRGAGWQFAPIGGLYGLTPERVRQLVATPTRTDVDDGEEVA